MRTLTYHHLFFSCYEYIGVYWHWSFFSDTKCHVNMTVYVNSACSYWDKTCFQAWREWISGTRKTIKKMSTNSLLYWQAGHLRGIVLAEGNWRQQNLLRQTVLSCGTFQECAYVLICVARGWVLKTSCMFSARRRGCLCELTSKHLSGEKLSFCRSVSFIYWLATESM